MYFTDIDRALDEIIASSALPLYETPITDVANSKAFTFQNPTYIVRGFGATQLLSWDGTTGRPIQGANENPFSHPNGHVPGGPLTAQQAASTFPGQYPGLYPELCPAAYVLDSPMTNNYLAEARHPTLGEYYSDASPVVNAVSSETSCPSPDIGLLRLGSVEPIDVEMSTPLPSPGLPSIYDCPPQPCIPQAWGSQGLPMQTDTNGSSTLLNNLQQQNPGTLPMWTTPAVTGTIPTANITPPKAMTTDTGIPPSGRSLAERTAWPTERVGGTSWNFPQNPLKSLNPGPESVAAPESAPAEGSLGIYPSIERTQETETTQRYGTFHAEETTPASGLQRVSEDNYPVERTIITSPELQQFMATYLGEELINNIRIRSRYQNLDMKTVLRLEEAISKAAFYAEKLGDHFAGQTYRLKLEEIVKARILDDVGSSKAYEAMERERLQEDVRRIQEDARRRQEQEQESQTSDDGSETPVTPVKSWKKDFPAKPPALKELKIRGMAGPRSGLKRQRDDFDARPQHRADKKERTKPRGEKRRDPRLLLSTLKPVQSPRIKKEKHKNHRLKKGDYPIPRLKSRRVYV